MRTPKVLHDIKIHDIKPHSITRYQASQYYTISSLTVWGKDFERWSNIV